MLCFDCFGKKLREWHNCSKSQTSDLQYSALYKTSMQGNGHSTKLFWCRFFFFFLQVWVGNSWLDDWHLSGKSMDREQVCIIKKRPIRNKGWATPPFEDNWHTRNLHLSRPTGWQASGALPICPPSPSRGLDLSCLGPATKTAPLGEKNSENA